MKETRTNLLLAAEKRFSTIGGTKFTLSGSTLTVHKASGDYKYRVRFDSRLINTYGYYFTTN